MKDQRGLPRLVALLLLLGPVLAGCGDTAPGEPSARVIKIVNTAFACARTTGCTTPAALDAQVFAGGEARTGTPGTLDLQSATTTFRLEDGATLQLAAVDNAVQRLVLKAGRLFVNHDPSGRDQITVAVGTTRIDAVDTRFIVTVAGAMIDIGVPRPTAGKGTNPGQVTVTRGNARQVVKAGQGLTLPPGTGMPPVRTIAPDEQTRWNALQNWP